MTATTVAYRRDGGTARPAINVKCYAAGLDFWPPTPDNRVDAIDRHVAEAYDRVQSDFWQAAQEIATQRGLGEITQEGRSGGWLVIEHGDPDDMSDCYYHGDECDDPEDVEHVAARKQERADWLAAYRALAEWAETWIADAPRKVRDLAQSLAMDAAGESSVALRSWLAFSDAGIRLRAL